MSNPSQGGPLWKSGRGWRATFHAQRWSSSSAGTSHYMAGLAFDNLLWSRISFIRYKIVLDLCQAREKSFREEAVSESSYKELSWNYLVKRLSLGQYDPSVFVVMLWMKTETDKHKGMLENRCCFPVEAQTVIGSVNSMVRICMPCVGNSNRHLMTCQFEGTVCEFDRECRFRHHW